MLLVRRVPDRVLTVVKPRQPAAAFRRAVLLASEHSE